MKPARRHATYDDVRDASDLVVAELIEGDLYTSRPAVAHAHGVRARPGFAIVRRAAWRLR
jgi:hypothetical protein